MKRQSILLLAIIVIFLGTHGVTQADLTGYVVTEALNSEVYWTNFDTGVQVSLGPCGRNLRSLAIDPRDGTLYASGPSDNLWKIDKTTGKASFVSVWGGNSLSFAPDGTLYAIAHADRLAYIDLVTGAWSIPNNRQFPLYNSVWAFAIDSTGKGIGWDLDTQSLFEINLFDYSTTLLGHLPGFFKEFEYGLNGTLYGWSPENGLYSIDVGSVSATHLRDYAFGGEGFALIPVPSAVILGSLGLTFSGWMLKRKRMI